MLARTDGGDKKVNPAKDINFMKPRLLNSVCWAEKGILSVVIFQTR
jgi:hypothetical protein